MIRNLSYIASQVFNQPIALEPAYARVFYSVLASKMGFQGITDSVTGEHLDAQSMAALASEFRYENQSKIEEDRWRYYDLIGSVAVLPVEGTLVHKYGGIRPYSGMTGYDGIVRRLEFAMNDEAVNGVLLDNDTPGGQVAGGFDAADIIHRYAQQKPVWALAHDMNCSAGQLLASACSRRLITQTGVAGSVGVVMAHANYEKLLQEQGTEITLIYSGMHKVDGNPYESLPDTVRAKFKTEVDQTRQSFAEKVSSFIGMPVEAVLNTEAQSYTGADAVDIGLADEVVNGNDAVGLMNEYLSTQSLTIVDMGATMTQENHNTIAADPDAPVAEDSAQSNEMDTESIASAERARVLAILNCEEAKGREMLASKLAEDPRISAESAKEFLASAPLVDNAVASLQSLSEEHGKPLESSASGEPSGEKIEQQTAALVSAYNPA